MPLLIVHVATYKGLENVVVLLGRKTKEKHVTYICFQRGWGEREMLMLKLMKTESIFRGNK